MSSLTLDEINNMELPELVRTRQALRDRVNRQNGHIFSSEPPYFVSSFDRIGDGIDFQLLSNAIERKKDRLPRRGLFILDQIREELERQRQNDNVKSKIPTRGGRR